MINFTHQIQENSLNSLIEWRDELQSLVSDANELDLRLLALWADGRYTMTSILALYLDLRNKINEAATRKCTNKELGKYRAIMLEKIEQKLERFETSAYVIHGLVTNGFHKASTISAILEEHRPSLLQDKNTLLVNAIGSLFDNWFGLFNITVDDRLKNLERDVILVQYFSTRFGDLENFLLVLTRELSRFRKKVQEGRNFSDDASWSGWRPEVLMGKFESSLASVQAELEADGTIKVRTTEESYSSYRWGWALLVLFIGRYLFRPGRIN